MRALYRLVAYLGLMSIFGSLIFGFRSAPLAPGVNLLLAVLLYLGFIVVHLIMTTPWFKRTAWGEPHDVGAERRVFILVTVVTWIGIYAVHPPVPGPVLNAPAWVSYLGVLLVLTASLAFFEGMTFAMLDAFLGVPGAAVSHSQGVETPLLTAGSYARVRHPMYRAAVIGCAASLLVHPNAGQLLWATMLAATFVLFIPIEERQLLRARGQAYRDYQLQTPYRIFFGIW